MKSLKEQVKEKCRCGHNFSYHKNIVGEEVPCVVFECSCGGSALSDLRKIIKGEK